MFLSKIKAAAMLLVLASPVLHAQPNTPSVDENDLRACLQLEQEGLQRFMKLETLASDLRGTEKLLGERRQALQDETRKLDTGKTDATTVSKFNESVNVFNQQADQLNADKAQFERDSAAYEHWMSTSLAPACDKLANKPVSPLTSYYACGFDGKQALKEVPHCKTLPNLDGLKDCIQKAGNKAKALSSCGS